MTKINFFISYYVSIMFSLLYFEPIKTSNYWLLTLVSSLLLLLFYQYIFLKVNKLEKTLVIVQLLLMSIMIFILFNYSITLGVIGLFIYLNCTLRLHYHYNNLPFYKFITIYILSVINIVSILIIDLLLTFYIR
jgi:hypothetical protein